MRIKDIQRDSDGKLPAYAWPGGYPLIYSDNHGSILCSTCATKSLDDPEEFEDYRPQAADILWEGPSQYCEGCNVEIASAYDDPENERSNEHEN